MEYIDDLDSVKENEEMMNDKASIATDVIDGLSVAPTEMLAAEYKRLMEQYEME